MCLRETLPGCPGISRRLAISLSSHSSLSCMQSGVSSLCATPPGCPWREPVALILVILERSPPELGIRGRDAAGAECGGHGVGKAPLLSLQWRPFPHANFTRRILLLFIFFIISYLSLPDVFRAVFCVVN